MMSEHRPHVRLNEITARLADALRRVGRGERVVLRRGGKDIAALVGVDDLRLLERLIEDEEDRLDVIAARRILADPKEVPIPYEDVRGALGLAKGSARRVRRRRAG